MASFGQMAAILNIGIRADTRQAQSALRQMDSTVSKTASNSKKLTTAAGQQSRAMSGMAGSTRKAASANKELDRTTVPLTSKLKGVGKAAAGAAAAYVGIGAAKDAVTTTEDLAKATLTLHRNLGLSAKAAGGLAAEAKVRGLDTVRLTMATKSYSNAVEGAKAGGATQIEQFKNLGISLKELKKDNPDQLLLAIADGATALGNTTEKTKALGTIFGRSFGPLAPLFRNGASGLREFIKANTDAGANLGAKGGGIKGVQDLIANQRQLKRESQGLQVEFTRTFGPPLITLMKGAIWWMKVLRKTWATFPGDVEWAKNAIVDAFHWIVKANHDANKYISRVWANLGDEIASPFVEGYKGAVKYINKIIGVINTVLGPIGVHIGEIGGGGGGGGKAPKGASGPTGPKNTQKGAPVGTSGPTPKKAFGGIVPGSGSGDSVLAQALVEPGEGMFVLNRNAMGGLAAINKAIPRRARGGLSSVNPSGRGATGHPVTSTSAAGGFGLPGVGGLPQWLQAGGEFVRDKALHFITSKLASVVTGPFTGKRGGGGSASWGGVPIASWIAPELKWAQKKGWSGTVLSGYRDFATQAMLYARYLAGGNIAAPPGSSEHESLSYPGGAVDVTDWQTLAGMVGKYPGAQKLIWYGPGDQSHFSGTGHKRGGAVPNPKHGSHWIKGGSNWSVDEAATLLWQAGLPMSQAAQLARVVPGESGGNPRAHNASGATGLFQILGALVPGNLYDPRINALNAVAKFRSQGFGAWAAGRSGPAGRILRSAVGGRTAAGGRGAGPGGILSFGSHMTAAKRAKLEARNTRNLAINDLVGASNLEGLQRYGVGAGQAGALGIPGPSAPTQGGMLPIVVIVEDGAVDSTKIHAIAGKAAHKKIRRAARRGNRPLPSGGGG